MKEGDNHCNYNLIYIDLYKNENSIYIIMS